MPHRSTDGAQDQSLSPSEAIFENLNAHDERSEQNDISSIRGRGHTKWDHGIMTTVRSSLNCAGLALESLEGGAGSCREVQESETSLTMLAKTRCKDAT